MFCKLCDSSEPCAINEDLEICEPSLGITSFTVIEFSNNSDTRYNGGIVGRHGFGIEANQVFKLKRTLRGIKV